MLIKDDNDKLSYEPSLLNDMDTLEQFDAIKYAQQSPDAKVYLSEHSKPRAIELIECITGSESTCLGLNCGQTMLVVMWWVVWY